MSINHLAVWMLVSQQISNVLRHQAQLFSTSSFSEEADHNFQRFKQYIGRNTQIDHKFPV